MSDLFLITEESVAKLKQVAELCERIDYMVNAPYWTSDRRHKMGEIARRAKEAVDQVTNGCQSYRAAKAEEMAKHPSWIQPPTPKH